MQSKNLQVLHGQAPYMYQLCPKCQLHLAKCLWHNDSFDDYDMSTKASLCPGIRTSGTGDFPEHPHRVFHIHSETSLSLLQITELSHAASLYWKAPFLDTLVSLAHTHKNTRHAVFRLEHWSLGNSSYANTLKRQMSKTKQNHKHTIRLETKSPALMMMQSLKNLKEKIPLYYY